MLPADESVSPRAAHDPQRRDCLAGVGDGVSGLVAAVSVPLVAALQTDGETRSARSGLKHQRRSAAMQHYVGLDVSVKETSVCIVDKAGKVIREVKVATKPAEILAVLTEEALAIERIGLEAGPLSQWLYSAEAGLLVICVETRHMKAALSARINKSDRNDARGIAQMMRVGLYRPVHVKTLASQKRRMLLTSRQLLQAKALDIENDLRGTLRNYGLKVGMAGPVKFEEGRNR